MDYGTILVDIDGSVATIMLNRPDRLNAWNWQMHAELRHVFNALDAEDAIRAIVVTGAGRAFCAGMDLGGGGETFSGGSGQGRDYWLERYPGPNKSAHELSTPIIAAINGPAVGAGLTMPLEWDLRFASEDAKLGFVFNRRGIMPDADLLWSLPRMIGFSRALDLLLTGRIFTGREAAEIGLVSRALPASQVLDVAREAAWDIARNVGPVSAAITKRLAYRFQVETDREAALALQTALFAWTGRQPDAKEGVTAFLEKRDPAWTMSKTKDLPPEMQ